MSLTGRPSSPPLALMSSSQICIATSDILPLAARGPVSDILKPTLIGSAALIGVAANSSAATAADHARRLMLSHCDPVDISIPFGDRNNHLKRRATLTGANRNSPMGRLSQARAERIS